MKSRVLIVILLMLLPLSSFAQEEDTMIYEFPDVEAQFPGGHVALMKLITSNIEYPEAIIDQDMDGRLYFSFVVEKDGSLTDVKLEKGMGYNYADDLLCFFEKMPNWIPGEVRGEVVRTRCRLPILICPLH